MEGSPTRDRSVDCYLAFYPRKRMLQIKPLATPSEHWSLLYGKKQQVSEVDMWRAYWCVRGYLEDRNSQVLFKPMVACENSTYGRFHHTFEALLHWLREEVVHGCDTSHELPEEKRPVATTDAAFQDKPMVFHTSHSRHTDEALCEWLRQPNGLSIVLYIKEVRVK